MAASHYWVDLLAGSHLVRTQTPSNVSAKPSQKRSSLLPRNFRCAVLFSGNCHAAGILPAHSPVLVKCCTRPPWQELRVHTSDLPALAHQCVVASGHAEVGRSIRGFSTKKLMNDHLAGLFDTRQVMQVTSKYLLPAFSGQGTRHSAIAYKWTG